MTIRLTIEDVICEARRQVKVYGPLKNHNPYTWATILAKRVNKYTRAVLEDSNRQMREEAVRIAAFALQIVEALDKKRSTT